MNRRQFIKSAFGVLTGLAVLLMLFGCKDKPTEPIERVLIQGRTQYRYSTGIETEEDEWKWKECEIIEKKAGLWKVKAVGPEVTFPISWDDPNKITYKEIH